MKNGKIFSKIDFHREENSSLAQYINYAKYDSEESCWISIGELFAKPDFDFIDLLFLKLTGKKPNYEERRLLLKTLLITSLGTGCHPPSVMVPKLIASTTKNKEFAIINGLIGGLSTIGTDHLGAVVGCMKMLKQLGENAKEAKDACHIANVYISVNLSRGDKIKGFGHPVYRKDPRPALLLNEVKQTFQESKYVAIYEEISLRLSKEKNIQPNIDAALALSYLSLGFEPEHGIYLSFISRSLSMVLHILEEFPKKPFSFLNEIASIEDFWQDLQSTDKEFSETYLNMEKGWKEGSIAKRKKDCLAGAK